MGRQQVKTLFSYLSLFLGVFSTLSPNSTVCVETDLSHQADLGDRRVVSPKAGAEAAAALGLQYFESSAKDQTGVEVRIGQNRDFIHYLWQAVPNVKPVLLYFSTFPKWQNQVILRSDAISC